MKNLGYVSYSDTPSGRGDTFNVIACVMQISFQPKAQFFWLEVTAEAAVCVKC